MATTDVRQKRGKKKTTKKKSGSKPTNPALYAPKCVPRSKAKSMTSAQRKSAVQRKRAAGNPGGKPTNVKTIVKSKNTKKTRSTRKV
jgi:hypothetical protein